MITHPFRRALVGLAAMVIALSALVGCGNYGTNNAGYYDTLCVNPVTQVRMPDYYCSPGVYYHPSWMYYVPLGYAAPGYGVHITHYTVNHFHRPANATIHTGGVPASGGKATRFKTGNSKPVNLTKNTRNGGGYKPKSRLGGGFHRSGRR